MEEPTEPPITKIWKWLEAPWFWGGVALILGASAATVPLSIIFAIGYVPVAVGIVRSDFFKSLTSKWRKFLSNTTLLAVVAVIFFFVWKVVPKPKEPPTVDDIANAVKKKLDEKQDIQPLSAENTPPKEQSKPKPKTKLSTPSSKPKPIGEAPLGNGEPPNQAHLSVTQSYKTSTRPDAPVETEVVVQTDMVFPSLKFVMQCDKPLIDAQPMIGGGAGAIAQMAVSRGLAQGHPNIVVYSYGSSAPPFGPANPLVIDVWSAEPVKCEQVATF